MLEGSRMLVIGIDCATQPNKTGMVLASWERSELRLEEASLGSVRAPPVGVISSWIPPDADVLLALDAPLGWPKALGGALANHGAGQLLRGDPEQLFRRATDRRIEKRLRKRPLEVGANLIARTAHAALKLLEEIRQRTGHSVPLVWEPSSFSGVGAIEVYPAATRIAIGASKDPASGDGLSSHVQGDLSKVGESPHVRDAAWCAVAGSDFLAGLAEGPTDIDLSRSEGWIWVRRSGNQ